MAVPPASGRAKRKHHDRVPSQRQGQKRLHLRAEEDEEIDSEDEELAQEAGRQLDRKAAKQRRRQQQQENDTAEQEDEDFFRHPDDERVDLAKRFLEKIGLGTKTDEEVAERLQHEAEVASKKVRYDVADQVAPLLLSWP